MKLFNSSPEQILGKDGGNTYFVDIGKMISVTDTVGSRLLEKFGDYGLVCLDVPAGFDGNSRSYVVIKMLEGLDRRRTTYEKVIQSFKDFDTELKMVNQHGTILEHPKVKDVLRLLRLTCTMVKDLEAKYGVSIAKDEELQASEALISGVEQFVEEFQADTERVSMAREEEAKSKKEISEVQDFFTKEFEPEHQTASVLKKDAGAVGEFGAIE